MNCFDVPRDLAAVVKGVHICLLFKLVASFPGTQFYLSFTIYAKVEDQLFCYCVLL